MVDIRYKEIRKDDRIAFILNERGSRPRLVPCYVLEENSSIIVVQDDNVEIHRLRQSQRSFEDGRLLSSVVLGDRSDTMGSTTDCTGYPVNVGDIVAFMEAPSQGFSTSLRVGEVLRLEAAEVTIKDVLSGQKYKRKTAEVAVVE